MESQLDNSPKLTKRGRSRGAMQMMMLGQLFAGMGQPACRQSVQSTPRKKAIKAVKIKRKAVKQSRRVNR